MKMTSACAIFIVCSLACGGSSSSPAGGADVRGAYPSGPYGVSEGAVIEPLAFELPGGGARSLEDVWKDDSRTLLLLVTSSGWCVACIDEQPELRRYHETYGGLGLAIIEALFEDAAFQPATVSLAESWKRQYSLPFDVVADPQFLLGRYYNRDLTPMNMIVDVTTMKILRISTGFDPNAIEAIFAARLL